MKLTELANQNNRPIKVAVYGQSGTGKTCFATGFPGPIYVADFDGKISSAANFWKAKNPKKLDEIDFDNFQPTAENGGFNVFWKFQDKIKALEELARTNKFPFTTVVVDSLTTLSEAMMQAVIGLNPNLKRFEKTTPEMLDYKIFGSQFKPLIARILALPCNVVLIGHVNEVKDESTGSVTYQIALSGKLPGLIPTLFEEMYRTYVDTKDGKPIYVAQTVPMGGYTARTQIIGMPPKIALSYDFIKKVMEGSL